MIKPRATVIRIVGKISRHGPRAAFAGALMVMGAASAHAEAALPEGTPTACFEMFSPQGGVRSPLLLDKCRGQTWQLVPSHRVGGSRSGTLVYRWRPLVRPDGVAAAPARPTPAAARPVAARPAAAPSTGTRCFTFDGRRFCE